MPNWLAAHSKLYTDSASLVVLRCTRCCWGNTALLAWQLLETSSACSCPRTPEGAMCKAVLGTQNRFPA